MTSRGPRVGWLDVRTVLHHFAIVTFTVDPAALRPYVHERFDLDTIVDDSGRTRALISVVPFEDHDFAFARLPWPRWTFGQTNYRAYVRDTATGERAVWFFGTVVDFAGVVVPRYAWRLPWHHASIEFDCKYDEGAARYERYAMTARSAWAPATLELADTGVAPTALTGFASLEDGLLALTHPLSGYYYRRDGRLGNYSVWHPRIKATVGRVVNARFPVLERLGVLPPDGAYSEHSVLIQPRIDFVIHLPPGLEPSLAERAGDPHP